MSQVFVLFFGYQQNVEVGYTVNVSVTLNAYTFKAKLVPLQLAQMHSCPKEMGHRRERYKETDQVSRKEVSWIL
jgi:hypothetical protein